MSPSGNPHEIEVSEELLQRGGLILLAILVVFTVIGAFTSPVDEFGSPVLLVPEVKEFEDYRRSGMKWISQMSALDGQISGVLAGEHAGDLFTQSHQAQGLLQDAVSLVQEIDRVEVPMAAAGIHDQLYGAAMAYLDAARLAMRWVAAPEDELKREIEQKLAEARSGRNALEKNQWLKQP